MVDEDYAIVGVHIDENMRRKIINGEFIDFAKLIPHDHVAAESDHRLEIVHRDGQTFFQPVSEREMVGINSIFKWDQAFQIFSTIYNEAHPLRATELLQNSHIIHHASQLFAWDNIYAYDIDFHLHIAKHPERSWGIILQQSWSMRLQDRLNKSQFMVSKGEAGSSKQGNFNGHFQRKKICWQYNQGNCEYGFNCIFCNDCEHHGCI